MRVRDEYMKLIGIYSITNSISGKVYIGSSINVGQRLKHHLTRLRTGNHKSKHIQSSFNKYGQEAFSCELLEVCESEQLLSREEYYIEQYKSLDRRYGYNKHLPFRNEGFKHSEETKKKLSRIQIGKKLTPEHKQRISDAQRGIPKHDEETRKRIALSNRRLHMSEETEGFINDSLINKALTARMIVSETGISMTTIMSMKRSLEEKGIIISQKKRKSMIIDELNKGININDIADMYDVSNVTIYNIKKEMENIA